jgi:glycosyltransferase involved in cell wall biosynthesis
LKVLHVLYQSLPHESGSTIRSRDIVASQKDIGIETIIITSPFQEPKNCKKRYEIIEGVKYYRTFRGHTRELHSQIYKGIAVRIKKLFRMPHFAYQIYKIAKKENINIIHAHATFYCALSSLAAARCLRIPILYEVRSLWEQRQLKYDKSLKAVIQVRIIRTLETLSMRLVDRVIVINSKLKKNLKTRGIKEKKISVVPNAVYFNRIPHNQKSLIYKPRESITFGYIGNIHSIEGLDGLIRVFGKLYKKGYPNRLLIYGNGSAHASLMDLIFELGISNVKLMGGVIPAKISEAYDQIDIIVNPRKKSELTDTVTPLKPLEAMAYRKLVIASNVGGMRELINDRKTGLLFDADNFDEIAVLIEKVLFKMASNEIEKIIENAYNFVKENKSWNVNSKIYKQIYYYLVRKE